jgi:hypothetical protein
MKLSPEECRLIRRRVAEIQPTLERAEATLREMRTNDPGRGDIVVKAARLFAELARLERRLDEGGCSVMKP